MTAEATTVQPATNEQQNVQTYRPRVDIIETGDELRILADLPGARNDSIDVDFKEGMLEIRAAIEPRHLKSGRSLRQEYGVGDFYRRFQVSEVIDVSNISAEFHTGVLVVHLPKVAAAKARKIQVTGA